MKRLLVFSLLLAMLVVAFAGCGSGGEATSPDGGEATGGGPVGQAEAASCSANRRTIAAAAQQYYAVEGMYPSSIQQLVPGYLQSMPACPSGGVYTLQGSTVTCSVHGQ